MFFIPLILAGGAYLGWKANNAVTSLATPAPTVSPSASGVMGLSWKDVLLLGSGGWGVFELMKFLKKKRA